MLTLLIKRVIYIYTYIYVYMYIYMYVLGYLCERHLKTSLFMQSDGGPSRDKMPSAWRCPDSVEHHRGGDGGTGSGGSGTGSGGGRTGSGGGFRPRPASDGLRLHLNKQRSSRQRYGSGSTRTRLIASHTHILVYVWPLFLNLWSKLHI